MTVLASAGAVVEVVAWICTAAMGLLALSQIAGFTGWVVIFALQATTPFALAPALPIAIVAAFDGRVLLAVVDAGIALVLAWLLLPVVRHGGPPSVTPEDAQLTIAFANTLYENERTRETAHALLDLGADVLAIVEHTPAMETSLVELGVLDRYPYRAGASEVTRDGVRLFSRHPLSTAVHGDIGDVPGIDAVLDVDGAPLRIIVVHPVASVTRPELRSWRRDLATLRTMLISGHRSRERIVVVGDYNACRWHPDFRALLDGTGFRLAHEWLGHGFTTSWEIGGRLPAFVRIDHALLHGVTPVAVRDMDTPGSDHRAFALTLALPRPSA